MELINNTTKTLRDDLELLSIAAMAVCIVLVYVIVVMLSGRVIAPMIKNEQKQKEFITDAGHELKTPIAVIATSLTVLGMEGASRNG